MTDPRVNREADIKKMAESADRMARRRNRRFVLDEEKLRNFSSHNAQESKSSAEDFTNGVDAPSKVLCT